MIVNVNDRRQLEGKRGKTVLNNGRKSLHFYIHFLWLQLFAGDRPKTTSAWQNEGHDDTVGEKDGLKQYCSVAPYLKTQVKDGTAIKNVDVNTKKSTINQGIIMSHFSLHNPATAVPPQSVPFSIQVQSPNCCNKIECDGDSVKHRVCIQTIYGRITTLHTKQNKS